MQKTNNNRLPRRAISFGLLLFISLALFVTYMSLKSMLNDAIGRETRLINNFYYAYEAYEADEIDSIIKLIMQKDEIKKAFIKKDREEMLRLAEPIYEDLRANRNISHFYLTGQDRVNILRLHNPNRYGDTIDRATQLAAEKTKKGTWGLELGPFGTFTLRVVSPWYDGGELVGYIELGKEIEHFVGSLKQLFGIRAYVFIYKDHIKRGKWEDGLEMLDRQAAWDRFRSSVNIGENIEGLPTKVVRFMAEEKTSNFQNFDWKGRRYQARFIPLLDVRNLEVGRISVLFDITGFYADYRRNIILLSAIIISTGMLLIMVFNHYLKRLHS